MSIKRPSLLLLLALTILMQAPAQTAATFSVQQLKQDYELFVRALKEAHPGLYRYTARESFDSLFQQTEKEINKEMTEEAFFLLLRPLVAKIHCGHTKLHRAGAPDDHFPFHKEGILPLKLYFTNNKAYVVDNYIKKGIKPGSEVLSINGKGIPVIMQQLRSYFTGDGYIGTSFYEELNHFFNGDYATYVQASPSFQIAYKEGKLTKSVTLPAITMAVLQDKEKKSKGEKTAPHRLTFPTPQTAVLTIERFYTNTGERPYFAFIDSAFQVLRAKNTPSLVIDLRNNEGGIEEWGGYLYSYLAVKDFRYYNKIKVARKEPFTFREYASLPEQYDAARALIVERNGEFFWPMQEYLNVKSPKPNAFQGRTYILINGLSFSVTSEFAAVVHQNKQAEFIGDETGGAYEGDNSGVFARVTLPNTKLNVGIPLFAYYMNVTAPEKGRGIQPCHTITPTVKDILQKRDVVLEYTLKQITSK